MTGGQERRSPAGPEEGPPGPTRLPRLERRRAIAAGVDPDQEPFLEPRDRTKLDDDDS